MRQIYTPKKLRSILTQGSIISGCIASDYEGRDVAGLIVTPRCDLDHNIKVSTVHYLPIVQFDDWIKIDGFKWLKDQLLKDLKEQLNTWVKNNTGIVDFLSTTMATKSKMERLTREYDSKDKYKNIVDLYFTNDNSIIKEHLKKTSSYYSKLIKNLTGNMLSQFYLIEDWEGRASYHVVILRELHQISRDTAKQISKGLFADEQSQDFFNDNSLRRPESSCPYTISYEILATLDSPVIEHLIQRFVNNFSKIGVEDFDIEEVKSKTIDIKDL